MAPSVRSAGADPGTAPAAGARQSCAPRWPCPSVHLDPGIPHHLLPAGEFGRDRLAELGGAAGIDGEAGGGQALGHLGLAQGGDDRFVQPGDGRGGRAGRGQEGRPGGRARRAGHAAGCRAPPATLSWSLRRSDRAGACDRAQVSSGSRPAPDRRTRPSRRSPTPPGPPLSRSAMRTCPAQPSTGQAPAGAQAARAGPNK